MTEQKYKFDASKTKLGYGAVDIVVNMYTPEVIGRGIMPTDDNFKDKVRLEGDHRKGLTEGWNHMHESVRKRAEAA